MHISATNVPRAYEALLWQMRIHAKPEESRAGPVLVMPEPTHLTIHDPMERVLMDPSRDANPFFHLMETIWMLAGQNDVGWLLNFNKRYSEYSDMGAVRGAYGFRWRTHFGIDQIIKVAEMLRKDPETRRAVIAMWDPGYDLEPGYHDYPCNTHIYFRAIKGRLDMTVCNRSNDFFWGMMGANCVHMTILQEIIAGHAGLRTGRYHVFTNNLHVYQNMPRFEELWASVPDKDPYSGYKPVLPWYIPDEKWPIEDFLQECYAFVVGNPESVTHPWLRQIALPMLKAWTERQLKLGDGLSHIQQMPTTLDWRKAAEEWINRRQLSASSKAETSSSSTLTEPSPSTSTESTSSESNQSDGTSISTSAEAMKSTIQSLS